MKIELNNQPRKVPIGTILYGFTFTKCGESGVYIVVNSNHCSQVPSNSEDVFAVNLANGRIVAFNKFVNVIPVSTKVVGDE